jgi:bifunctional non-homologous end joining protein LigD
VSLKEYKVKRDFKETAEPKGKPKSLGKPLIFVVQKHRATSLHYDFRLELNGVLKSWAVPKGPSMKPGEKRLAMMVEDHPYDYKNFEGIIPEGNYGAGEVIVWDSGIYAPIGMVNSKKENEKILTASLLKGDLKFVLAGKKLQGEFALVNMKKDGKSWLLIKKKDEYALDKDILEKDKSVISNNTIEKLQKASKRNSKSRKT